jgi:hypothetical protein
MYTLQSELEMVLMDQVTNRTVIAQEMGEFLITVIFQVDASTMEVL